MAMDVAPASAGDRSAASLRAGMKIAGRTPLDLPAPRTHNRRRSAVAPRGVDARPSEVTPCPIGPISPVAHATERLQETA